jgi:hypothetical protein
MSTPETPEMSPESAAIIARARKSFMFTIGLLILGFIVIGGALVYRATRDAGTPAPAATGTTAYSAAAVKIPSGATIISAVASGGDISVTYKNGSATSMRVFDGTTGAILREIPIVSE